MHTQILLTTSSVHTQQNKNKPGYEEGVHGHSQGIPEAAAPEPRNIGDRSATANAMALHHPQRHKDIRRKAGEECKRKETDPQAKADEPSLWLIDQQEVQE